MPVYKISYFNLMGRAELCRLLLSAADKDFEDDRFEKEEWPERKPSEFKQSIKNAIKIVNRFSLVNIQDQLGLISKHEMKKNDNFNFQQH